MKPIILDINFSAPIPSAGLPKKGNLDVYYTNEQGFSFVREIAETQALLIQGANKFTVCAAGAFRSKEWRKKITKIEFYPTE